MANAYIRPNVAGSGATFAQLQAAGLPGHLDLLVAAQPQPGSPNAAPTSAPTVAATVDAGSTLPTATYYVVQTETNGFGETTASPVSSGQAITSGTNHLTVTTTSSFKSGNTGANIYIGTSNTGPFQLAAVGIAANTAVAFSAPLAANSWSTATPPTANTTALSAKQLELIRSAKNGDLQRVVQHAASVVTDFLKGDAMPYSSAIKHLQEADAAIAVLYKLVGEIGALVVANPGTITTVAVGPHRPSKRTFP